jgi:hypothetical protein
MDSKGVENTPKKIEFFFEKRLPVKKTDLSLQPFTKEMKKL